MPYFYSLTVALMHYIKRGGCMDNTKYNRQLELERESLEWGRKAYNDKVTQINMGERDITDLPIGQRLLQEATLRVTKALKEFIFGVKRGAKAHSTVYFKEILDSERIKVEDLAYLAVRRVLFYINSHNDSMTFTKLCTSCYRDIEDHIVYSRLKHKMPSYVEAVKKAKQTTHSSDRIRDVFTSLAKNKGIPRPEYDETVCANIGAKLVQLTIDSGGFCEKIKSKEKGKEKIRIEFLKSATDWMNRAHDIMSVTHPCFMPMIVEPNPWSSVDNGGYLTNVGTNRDYLVRVYRKKTLDRWRKDDLSTVYDALNIIQQTPWRINRRVLDILKYVWDKGGGVAKLPDRHPPEPSGKRWTDEEYQWLRKHDPETIKAEMRKKAEEFNVYQREKSKVVSIDMRILIGDKLKEETELYFPHNLDFRGRVYPIAHWISPQSDDAGKALIEFSKGEKLTDRGLYWLKVHIANCWGNDKVNNDDRAKWVDENHDMLYRIGDDPLEHREWHEADSPFRFLAGCFEYYSYCENGMDHVTHIPVSQDGSCNGLQHFSMMLRDTYGAVNTNLSPNRHPQDIYGVVLSEAKSLLKQSDHEWSDTWEENIDRALIKRPVMTVPYGVTRFGIQKQCYDHIRKERLTNPTAYPVNIGMDKLNKSCAFLSGVIEQAVANIVTSSVEVKEWLQDIAEIASKQDRSISWITPSGFRVVQEYKEMKTLKVDTMFQKTRIVLNIHRSTGKANLRKSVQAISPNFVHSLDASHLMLTVRECYRQGITSISTVHDSFSCLATDVDKMSQVLRMTFVDMYTSSDPLKQFYEDVSIDTGSKLPLPPTKGDFNPDLVKHSQYFFA